MFALWHYELADSFYIFILYHGVFSRLDRIVDYDCCRRAIRVFSRNMTRSAQNSKFQYSYVYS